MLTHKKVNPSTTASFSASILELICEIDPNKITTSIHHRIRELNLKLKKINTTKFKPSNTIKYFEHSIEKAMEVREVSKELVVLAQKLGKLHDKVIQPDIKNAVALAKASGKSALENIKTNKSALKKII